MTTFSALPGDAVLRRFEIGGGPLAVAELPARGSTRGTLAVAEFPARGTTRGTAVLVPGFTGSKEDFRLLLDPLADAGIRVVAVDQRGQHDSPGPDDLAAYTVAALAGDLLALLQQLGGGPVHLVGHSFGGLVARAAAIRQPAALQSLVLMDSGPAALTGPRTELLPFLTPLLRSGGTAAVQAALDDLPDPRRDAQVPEVRDFLRRRFLANNATGLEGMAVALTSEPDRTAELRSTGLPLLVLHGEHDDAWLPATQAEMAERLGARYRVVPGAEHSPAVENPAATAAELLSFWADLPN